MTRRLIAPVLALAALPAAARAADRPEIRIAVPPARPGWFACDAIDGPLAALFGAPDAGRTSIVTLVDLAARQVITSRVTVGRADPGAGQVYYALSRGGRAVGTIHMVNPAMVGDPALPTVTSVDLDGRHLECRFMPDMRFLGIAAGRSVMVRGQGVGLVYESFDRTRGAATQPDGVHRSNPPSLTIADGQAAEGGYRFTNKGVDYLVSASGVVARQGSRVIARDVFLASEDMKRRVGT